MGFMALVVGDSMHEEVKAPKFSSSKGLRSELLMPPGGSYLGSVRPEPVFEENAPKESDASKLFIGIAEEAPKAAAVACRCIGVFSGKDSVGVSCQENSVAEENDVAMDVWKGSKAESEGCAEDKFCSEDLLGLPFTGNSASEVAELANDDLPANRSMLSCNEF
ncbi:hypothetical protein ACP70R_036823 [Stipagrostis hirtigluma subsp. patula]